MVSMMHLPTKMAPRGHPDRWKVVSNSPSRLLSAPNSQQLLSIYRSCLLATPVHGLYHVLIGGQSGHMSSVPVAAFDPMFWLHHCQIDRWFAIWQAIHPSSWMSNDQANLLPFRTSKNPAKFWSSRASKSTQDFGYTYADLVGNSIQVENAFKNHYSWSVRTASQPKFGIPPADMTPLDLSKAPVFQFTQSAAVTDHAVNLMAAAAPAGAQQPLAMAQRVVSSTIAAAKEVVDGATKETMAQKKNVPEDPAQRKKIAKERAFKNLGDAQKSITAASDVQESTISREWFVDDVVER